MTNDVAVLDETRFRADPRTIRYGASENPVRPRTRSRRFRAAGVRPFGLART